jgi:hypothetical protein
LVAQGPHVTTVLVKNKESRLVNESIASPNYAIENIQISPTGNGGARIQGFVETSDFTKHVDSERHIRAGAENAGAAWV